MFKKIQKYLNRRKVIAAVGSFDERGLLIAIEEVKRDLLEILIKAEVSVNCKDDRGSTALIKAIKANDLPMVKMLIEAGADIDTKDKEGKTPIMKAIEGGNKHIFSYLMLQYPDLELTDKLGDTALLKAAKEGSTTISRKLIDAEVDVDATNHKGVTALMIAVDHLRTGIIKSLLHAGADPNIRDHQGRSVFDRHHSSPRITQMLKEAAVRYKLKDGNFISESSPLNQRESILGQVQNVSSFLLSLTADALNVVEQNEKLKELETKGAILLTQLNPDNFITAEDREKVIDWMQEQLNWGLNLLVHLKDINANLDKLATHRAETSDTNIHKLQHQVHVLLKTFSDFLAEKEVKTSPVKEDPPQPETVNPEEIEIPYSSSSETESPDHE